MALSRCFSPVLHFDDDEGHPLVGGWLCTYLARTNTPVKTYKDASGAYNETEIHLDSRGECEVWLDVSVQYKFALYDSTKTNLIWVKDNVSAGAGTATGDEKVVVAGTSPVNVSSVVSNGIKTYMVALEQSFLDAVANNTTAIANEIERATTEERTLSERIETVNETLSGRITDETTRAQAAEASARTVVRAGEGIQVDKVVDTAGDGHDEYFVSAYLPEATSTRFGVVKTGDDTVQNVPKNTPSQNKHRTYPVQKNADGQMVVNVPWSNDFKNVYKGILILTIEGTCTDTYSPTTAETSEHVTTKIVSPDYGEGSSFYGNNTFSVEYHEESGHPADHRPEFRVDNAGKLLFTFENEQQESLAFHFMLSISSKSGYQYIEDNEPVFAEWGHDSSMQQAVMDMVRTLVIRKSDNDNVYPILGNGISLASPRIVDLETTYKIEAVAEYLYTCSPPEFFIFYAVDDEGDNMVDDEGDNMIICEDNPNYIGA